MKFFQLLFPDVIRIFWSYQYPTVQYLLSESSFFVWTVPAVNATVPSTPLCPSVAATFFCRASFLNPDGLMTGASRILGTCSWPWSTACTAYFWTTWPRTPIGRGYGTRFLLSERLAKVSGIVCTSSWSRLNTGTTCYWATWPQTPVTLYLIGKMLLEAQSWAIYSLFPTWDRLRLTSLCCEFSGIGRVNSLGIVTLRNFPWIQFEPLYEVFQGGGVYFLVMWSYHVIFWFKT